MGSGEQTGIPETYTFTKIPCFISPFLSILFFLLVLVSTLAGQTTIKQLCEREQDRTGIGTGRYHGKKTAPEMRGY